MAHSIRNPERIHMVEERPGYDIDKTLRYRYLCNTACSTTPSKSTTDPSNVTCKNCIREMKRRQP